MIIYNIITGREGHWLALVNAVGHLGIVDEKYFDKMKELLAPFNGAIIQVARTYTISDNSLWIHGIQFQTEEDLLMFKLTFN